MSAVTQVGSSIMAATSATPGGTGTLTFALPSGSQAGMMAVLVGLTPNNNLSSSPAQSPLVVNGQTYNTTAWVPVYINANTVMAYKVITPADIYAGYVFYNTANPITSTVTAYTGAMMAVFGPIGVQLDANYAAQTSGTGSSLSLSPPALVGSYYADWYVTMQLAAATASVEFGTGVNVTPTSGPLLNGGIFSGLTSTPALAGATLSAPAQTCEATVSGGTVYNLGAWVLMLYVPQLPETANIPGLAVTTTTDGVTGAPEISVQPTLNENLLSYADSTMEPTVDYGAATAGQVLLVQTNQAAAQGKYSMQMAALTGGPNAALANTTQVNPSSPYQISAYFKEMTTTGDGVYVRVDWYTSAGTFISTSTSATVKTSGGGASGSNWFQAAEQVTSPSNAGEAIVWVGYATGSGTWLFKDASSNASNLVSSVGSVTVVPTPWTGFGQAIGPASGTIYAWNNGIANGVTGSAWSAEWVMVTPSTMPPTAIHYVLSRWNTSLEYLFEFLAGSSNLTINWHDSGGGNHAFLSSTSFAASTLYRCQLSWDGSNLRLFVNGVLDANFPVAMASAQTPAASQFAVGGNGAWVGGNISEVRISNIARNTAGYAPLIQPFTVDNNTLSLYHFNGNVNDSGPNGNNLTLSNGSYVTAPITGLTGQAVTMGAGSILWTPTGTGAADGAITTSAFTVEGIVVLSAADVGANSVRLLTRTSPHLEYELGCISGAAYCQIWDTGGTGHGMNVGALVANTVYHLAMSWDGTTIRLFINGWLAGSLAFAGTPATPGSQPTGIASASNGGSTFDEIRISKVARYTSAFIPTTGFTSDANTNLLYHLDAETFFVDKVALTPAPSSSLTAYDTVVTADSPQHWYKLNDSAAGTTCADSGNGSGGTNNLTCSVGFTSGPNPSGQAPFLSSSDGYGKGGTSGAGALSGAFVGQSFATLDFLACISPGATTGGVNQSGNFGTSGILLAGNYNSSTQFGWVLGVVNAGDYSLAAYGIFPGQLFLFISNGNSTSRSSFIATQRNISDGAWHHIAVNIASPYGPSSTTIYIDGSTAPITTIPAFTYSAPTLPVPTTPFYLGFNLPANCAMSELAFYTSPLSTQRIYLHASSAIAPWSVGGTSGEYAYFSLYVGPVYLQVQRSLDGGNTWTDVRLGSTIVPVANNLPNLPTQLPVADYEAAQGVSTQYRARMFSFNSWNPAAIVGDWGTASTPASATPASATLPVTEPWIIDPFNSASNCRANIQSPDGFQAEIDGTVGVLQGLSNPQHVVVTDTTTSGYNLTIKCLLTTAAQWAALLTQIKKTTSLMYQDPDGANYYFQWTKRNWTRYWDGSWTKSRRSVSLTAATVATP